MRQLIKRCWDSSFKNWPTLLLFDIAYKVFSYTFLSAMTSDLLSMVLKTAGLSYLSAENLPAVLTHPLALLLSLVLLVLVITSVFFETVALYLYCEAGWQQERLTILSLLKRTLRQCKKLLNVQNILLFTGFALTMILTVLPFSPYILQWLHIPEFMTDFIAQNAILKPLYGVAVLAANLVCLLFLLALPYTLFEDQPIKTAWKSGLQMLKKHKLASLLHLVGIFLLFGAALFGAIAVAILGLVAYIKLTISPDQAASIFTLYFMRNLPAGILLIGSLTTIWFFAVLITWFHQCRGDLQPACAAKQKNWLYYLKNTVSLLGAALILLLFSETELGGSFLYQPRIEPVIVAHRGGAAFAPENTMAALDNAISMGLDMVEIDVQQLRDGSLILLHDDNFGRTTGHHKKVWEVDYDQVQTYDAGSWFSPKFAGEPIPTLDAILQRAKGNIQLMIELKLTGHEENLVEQVVALIEKNDMLDQCNIGSLNLEVLQQAKSLNPQIKTIYITPMIFSGQYDIDFIDAFSVETTVMTREMVATMHYQKKEVFGWTANSKDTIQKNLRCQVNGIVTDDPILVQHYVDQIWESRVLNTVLRLFFPKAAESAPASALLP